MKIYKLILLIAILFSNVSCETKQKPSSLPHANEKLSAIFGNYRSFQYYTFPQYATYEGFHDYDDRLADQSIAAYDRYIDSIKLIKSTVLTIDKAALSPSNQLNYDLFLVKLNEDIDENELRIGNYLTFSQQNGFHIYFPQITGIQPLKTEKEVQNYIKRLEQFQKEANSIIADLKEGQEKGIVLPCSITEQVLLQLEGFVNTPTASNNLYTVINDSEAANAQKEAIQTAIETSVQPGYNALYKYYKEFYHPNCREAVGLSAISGGQAYYEFLVKKHTSTDLTPDEIFTIGESEVARIEAQIIEVQNEMGYGELSKQAFFDELRNNPTFYYSEKEDLLQGFRSILKGMDTKLPELFGHLPKTPYDLKEIEEYRAAAAPAAYYYNAPEDGSRPGYFYVNTYNLKARPKYTMTALALHEAVPGHHLQIALAKEMEDVPWFRNEMSVTAFVEGWGLYAEYLGYETGMYDDVIQKMGALTFEMWRACRLVVDVGMHYKGWTREEAIAYLKENLPITEPDIISEVDRYISWPGQALAYKIGELKLKALREKAETALGDQFDVRKFHDAVLENGSLPLSILEANIDAWIAETKQDN